MSGWHGQTCWLRPKFLSGGWHPQGRRPWGWLSSVEMSHPQAALEDATQLPSPRSQGFGTKPTSLAVPPGPVAASLLYAPLGRDRGFPLTVGTGRGRVRAWMKSGLSLSFKERSMRACLVTLVNLLNISVLATNAPAPSAPTAGEGAHYPALEPGVFMTRWLVCGPFPVAEAKDGAALEEKTQRQAFYRDYLA